MREPTKAAEGLTGRKVLAMFVLGFGTIVAANLTLAYNAVATFPGVEVENSYVESQHFDARRLAQEALGWTSRLTLQGDELVLELRDREGRPLGDAELGGFVGRATRAADDFEPDWRFDGEVFRAPATLDPGNWDLRLVASLGEDVYRRRLKMERAR